MRAGRLVISSALLCSVAHADTPSRPAIQLNRGAEDWSVLANPALRTQPLDSLKYIRLWGDDPRTYLSLGLTLREHLDLNDAPSFGVKATPEDAYLQHRLQIHADLHLDAHWNVFVQIEDVRMVGKNVLGPADRNPLDLRQAYVAFNHRFASATFKSRVGRQDFSFDLQRFVSLRDGANVRQSFDAVWMAWDAITWKVLGFVSLPVQYAHDRRFDDTPVLDHRFSLVRFERRVLRASRVSAYGALFERPAATYLDASGRERRPVIDVRFGGSQSGLDWDAEAMGQGGSVGAKTIRAWAIGARVGYAVRATRIGLQADAASGDRRTGDDTIGTFSPLYPNGYYFTYAGDTGYTNLLHLKPSLTKKLTTDVSVLGALGLQWRATTADAIYLHPNIPVAGTAGEPGAWTGAYVQLRADVRFGPDITTTFETVHFQAGDAIRRAGGGNSDYVGLEVRLSW